MTKTAEPVAALSAAILERLALMPMVYDAKHDVGKPIEDKDQEAAVLDAAVRALADAAAAAGTSPPPEQATRHLFEALIAMGKDVQQGLADDDAKRQRTIVRTQPSVAESAPAGAPPEPSEAAQPAAPAQPAAAAPPEQAPVDAPIPFSPSRKRIYDLGGDIRPALARITEKIARIIVSIDEPLAIGDVRRRLGDALASQGVRAPRIEAASQAIVEASAR